MNIKLTIFFDEPYWVGVIERVNEGQLETSRIVFGAEPKDYEVYFYLLKNYYFLNFSRPVAINEKEEKKLNPKRLQRAAHRETLEAGVGTRAQQAMKLEYETRKLEHKKENRVRDEELERMKFEKKQDKKKEKKKGH